MTHSSRFCAAASERLKSAGLIRSNQPWLASKWTTHQTVKPDTHSVMGAASLAVAGEISGLALWWGHYEASLPPAVRGSLPLLLVAFGTCELLFEMFVFLLAAWF